MPDEDNSPNQSAERRSKVIVPLIIAMALLMETIDATILSTAMPVIARDINAPILSLKLALASYLIALAAFLPASGWVADRYGAKKVFVAAMMVFLAGSLLCALQTDLMGLVLSRATQGAGGAMMVPVGRLIVLRSVAKQDMIRAMSYITVPALIGPAIGPLLGASLTTGIGWQSIFLINLPIGIVAIGLALWLLPDVKEPPRNGFDALGFVLSAGGSSMLMFGLAALGEHGVSTPVAAIIAAAGFLILSLYFVRSRNRADAQIDTTLLRIKTYRIGLIGGMLFRTSGGAAAFLLPLLFQIGFGLSVMISGSLSAVYAAGGFTMRIVAPKILERFGFRTCLVVGIIANGFSVAAFGLVSAPSYAVLLPLLLMAGFCQALMFTAVNGMVFADIPEDRMSHATSFSSVSQQFALTTGVSVAAIVLQLGGSDAPTAPIAVSHFSAAFMAIAAMSSLGLIQFLRLSRTDGDSLRHTSRTPQHRRQHHWI
jgi:EmrB/QacA subfamily drug resistance transporter